MKKILSHNKTHNECLYCNITYYKKKSVHLNKKYCSAVCYNKHKVELNKDNHIHVSNCFNCGGEYKYKYKKSRKFCSNKCVGEYRKIKVITIEKKAILIDAFNNFHNNNMTIEGLSKSIGVSKMAVGNFFSLWLSDKRLEISSDEYKKDLDFRMFSTNEMDYGKSSKNNCKYQYKSLSKQEKEIYNNLNVKK